MTTEPSEFRSLNFIEQVVENDFNADENTEI
jgi:hypothetical protein